MELSMSDLRMKYYGTADWSEMSDIMSKRQKEEWNNNAADPAKNIAKNWVKTEFPYYVPENELPCPLPTVAEIEAAGDTGNLYRGGINSVYRVCDVYAVKFSYDPIIFQVTLWPINL